MYIKENLLISINITLSKEICFSFPIFLLAEKYIKIKKRKINSWLKKQFCNKLSVLALNNSLF